MNRPVRQASKMDLVESRHTMEQCGPYMLTRYTVETEDQVQLAVHRLGEPPFERGRPVVILVHGSYTNRRFWISRSGKGFASFLAKAGFDVWIPETRGHGFSARGPGYRQWTARDVAKYDLPAVGELVRHETAGVPQCWIGHSYGGVYLTASLSMSWLDQSGLSAAVILGSQVAEGQTYLRFPPINWLFRSMTSALGKFPAGLLRLGSEDEPPGIMNEAFRWKANGRWQSTQGEDYAQGLGSIRIPFLAVAGAADEMDPEPGCRVFVEPIGTSELSFWALGKKHGYRKDYGHVDMLIGRDARIEIWPRLRDWVSLQTQHKQEGSTE